ncbi:ankyrin repeat-containing domain protein [Aspergillus varians]
MTGPSDNSTPDLAKFQVGWICALSVEAAAAKAMLDEDYGPLLKQTQGDKNIYWLGKIHHHYVAIATLPLGRPGTTTAAETAKDMLRTFGSSLRIGLLVGVAGGIPRLSDGLDIRLGDIVVSVPGNGSPGVVQYDFGKYKAEGNGELTPTACMNNPPDFTSRGVLIIEMLSSGGQSEFPGYLTDAIQKNEVTERNFGRPHPQTDRLFRIEKEHVRGARDCSACAPDWEEVRVTREREIPRVHHGTIASGNSVVKNAWVREKYSQKIGGALCFEMEAAGLMINYPCLVIRGICDYADSHKNDKWQGYAAMAAAAYAKELLKYIPVETVEGEKLWKDVCNSMNALGEQVKDLGDGLERTREQMDRHHNEQGAKALQEEQLKCHQALKTSNYEQHKNINPQAEQGTCLWILKNDKYFKWRYNSIRDLLWISADPGSGKSVLSRALVDTHLNTASFPVAVCYFFFKDNAEQERLATALCAILHQLFKQQPTLLTEAMPSWEINGEQLKNEPAELWRILMAAASKKEFKPTICVLDALDECRKEDLGQLLQMLKDIHKLTYPSSAVVRLKFLVTCRPYNNIQNNLWDIPDLSPHMHIQDIENHESIRKEIEIVLKSKVNELAQETGISLEVQQRLIENLSAMENFTYVWLDLVINDLRDIFASSFTPEMESIPTLPVSVDGAYAKILSKIRKADIRQVREIFKIIVGARRPLTSLEIGLALQLAVREDLRTRVDALIPEQEIERKIRQKCGLFVTVRNGFIHLFHQTAREFLVQKEPAGGPNASFCFTLAEAESTWARICIKYLLLDIDPLRVDDSTRTNCLRDYSAQHWVKHLRAMPSSLRAELEDSVYNIYAKRFGEWNILFWIVVVPFVHRPQPYFATHAAAFNGHTTVIQKLISEGKENAHQADEIGTTALLWSSWAGQYEASKLLIREGAAVNAVSQRYGTPLLVAALKGHRNIVQLLLENGADINQHCGKKRQTQTSYTRKPEEIYLSSHTGTALWAASLMGHFDIVQFLLQNGSTEIDFALMSASRGGYVNVIKLLIDHGADPNVRDEDSFYGTAIQAASQGGHLEILRFLIKIGAKDETGYGNYDSALQAAARNDYRKIVMLLLEHGTQHGWYSNWEYLDVLTISCNKDHLQAVTALAPLVTDINYPGGDWEESALQISFRRRDHEAVQVLLRNGACVPKGNSLREAAIYGDVEIMKMLIEKGADIHLGNPLVTAAAYGHVQIVRLLLEMGARINEGNPLASAAAEGHVEVVKTLLDQGANVNEGNPLSSAAGKDHVEVVQVLIKKGANVNMGYPLHAAACNDCQETARILLKHGADVNARYNNETALEVARSLGHFTIVMYISQTGAYIEPGARYYFPSHPNVAAGGDRLTRNDESSEEDGLSEEDSSSEGDDSTLNE